MYIATVLVILKLLFSSEKMKKLSSLMKMLVALFPLVDGKRSNRSGNEQNQIQNWPSINGKYENTLYTCIYQKHKVLVYTVEIGLNYQRNQIKVQNSFLSLTQAVCHVLTPWINIVPVVSHSHTLSFLKVREKKSFNLQSL